LITRLEAQRNRKSSMKIEELRAIQAPIKERYKTPPTALITLKAQGPSGRGSLATSKPARQSSRQGCIGNGRHGLSACSGDMCLRRCCLRRCNAKRRRDGIGVVIRSGAVRAEAISIFAAFGCRQGCAGWISAHPPLLRPGDDASEDELSTLFGCRALLVVYQTAPAPDIAVSHHVSVARK